MVINVNFQKIFELREYNDLYQKDIAKILNISQRTYSFFERGDKIIPLKHLNTLCNYYDISMDYILNLTDIKKYNNIKKLPGLDRKLIGNRIRLIRKENNLTLRDIAKELNTTSSTISAYETGKTLILTAFAYQICLKYNISMDWLCGKID